MHSVPQHEVREEDEARQLLTVPILLGLEVETAPRLISKPDPHTLVILRSGVSHDCAGTVTRFVTVNVPNKIEKHIHEVGDVLTCFFLILVLSFDGWGVILTSLSK